MRHKDSGRKLGRTSSHRKAMFRNMATSLIEKGRVVTTLHKAKEMRGVADSLITLGKKDTLAARRQAFQFVRSKSAVGKLFSELAPGFKNRHGGYSRVLKLGFRHGDSAAMAIIEYLPGEGSVSAVPGDDKKASKKAAPKKDTPKKEAPKKEKKEKAAAPKVKKAAKEKKTKSAKG